MSDLKDRLPATRAVSQALADYLLANMASLKSARADWPNPNDELEYPALTCFVRNPTFSPLMPYAIYKGPKDPATNLACVRKVVGMYDFTMQVDLWAQYKIQRDTLYEELFSAFSKNVENHGVRLKLGHYFDQWCDYSIADIETVDSEEGAQRNEWRLIVTVLANVRAVSEQMAHLIETIENNLETPTDIPAPAEEPPKQII